jgi:hypothetical protein
MVASHARESILEGIGFAVAGWFQLTMAFFLMTRSSRPMLRLLMLFNVVLIGAWALSRTWGLPLGEHAGHPEPASFVDLTAVGLEVTLVMASAVLLTHPHLGRAWNYPRQAFGSAALVGVVAITTAALTSPGAQSHASGSHQGHDAHNADADDLGLSLLNNGHHQHRGGEAEMNTDARAELAAQLAQTSELVNRYPTIAAAEAAGYRRAGPFVPGLGTHYIDSSQTNVNVDGRMDTEDIHSPALIYDGLDANSPLAGFMYSSWTGMQPEGFLGPNDHWHAHKNTCIVDTGVAVENPFGFDVEVTHAQCRKLGGTIVKKTPYMVHVWTVPGYESNLGTFSEVNPKLTCPDGTYYMKPIEKLRLSPTLCRE